MYPQMFTICHNYAWPDSPHIVPKFELHITWSIQIHPVSCFCCHTLSRVRRQESFKEMTGQRCISLSCWVGTKLGVRQEEIEIGRNGQQTAVLSYAAPQSQTVGCQQGWGVSAASVREEGDRTEVYCHNVAAVCSRASEMPCSISDFMKIYNIVKVIWYSNYWVLLE